MISHIEVHRIHRTIITFGFLVAMREKMFLHPARSQWMQSHGEKETRGHIGGCFPAKEINENGHETNLHDNIHYSPFIHQLHFFNTSRTYHLKNGVKQKP